MIKISSYLVSLIGLMICLAPGQLPAKSKNCKLPERGAQGPKGPQGGAGPQGATGPTGPFGLNNSFSASLENGQAVADQAAVLFDEIDYNQGNISYNPATGVFTLEDTGFYVIKYGITATTSNRQFGMRVNGSLSLEVGSVIDSEASDMVGVIMAFEVTSPMTTLELINGSGLSTILQTSTASSISAYFLIYQIQ